MSLDKATANISIHAPTRGATYVAAVRSIPGKISIHAPTRGATRKPDNNSNNSKFQSTLPRGERRRATEKSEVNKVFQSTLPRGERHKRPLFFVCEANFNPRSHEGSDQTLSSVRCSPQISIHAPTRGATIVTHSLHLRQIFQSTLPRGERRMGALTSIKAISYFNPRSHEGSDATKTYVAMAAQIFQSTLPRGERQHFSA